MFLHKSARLSILSHVERQGAHEVLLVHQEPAQLEFRWEYNKARFQFGFGLSPFLAEYTLTFPDPPHIMRMEG